MSKEPEKIQLKRSVGLILLILYGVGTMVGGGFYALLGKMAASAGYFVPLGFLLSSLLVLATAFSYAELSSRYPFSAGEAYYVHESFNRRWLTTTIGIFVVLTGIISAATLIVAIEGFVHDIYPLPKGFISFLLASGMGLIAVWGIGESLKIVAFITFIEVGALLLILLFHIPQMGDVTLYETAMSTFDISLFNGIFLGAFIAIYAFIGFEDMVNVAEEVIDVRRTLPLAILISLFFTTLLYVTVSWAAISAVGPESLAESLTPLATVMQSQGPLAEWSLRIVSILTAINGALVQVIMASRVLYGLANLKQLPSFFSEVSPKTQTPLKATVFLSLIIFILAIGFPLATLAQLTSTIILIVFAFVNLSLVIVKRRIPSPELETIRTYSIAFPIFGFITSCVFLAVRLFVAL